MLDARFSHLYFYQSLNRLQRGLSAIAELLVLVLFLLLPSLLRNVVYVKKTTIFGQLAPKKRKLERFIGYVERALLH